MNLPLGKQYLYVPRGPVGESNSNEVDMAKLLRARTESMFVRLDANTIIEGSKTSEVQPATTLITDLDDPTPDIMAAMHSKTRYNIRLAQKKGVEVKIGSIGEAFEAFVKLTEATYKRHGVGAHSRKHYEAILEAFDGSGDAPRAFMAVAKHDGEILAANMMVDLNGTRTYLHGASSGHKKNLMAPYLLHWKLMEDAKAEGLHAYDWWGIAPEDELDHKLAGVGRFKRGFGGEIVTSPTTVDIVQSAMWYKLYRIVQKFR